MALLLEWRETGAGRAVGRLWGTLSGSTPSQWPGLAMTASAWATTWTTLDLIDHVGTPGTLFVKLSPSRTEDTLCCLIYLLALRNKWK